jgi:hypothetical protein
MSKFIWKPDVIDFGYEPSVKTAKFIHQGTTISVLGYPTWIESVTLNYTAYTSGEPKIGSLTATVRTDATRHQEAGLITIQCDAEDYLIPVVYYYDSEHIPILDVIDSILTLSGEEGYIGPRDRVKAILAAKRWLQDNSGITGTNVRFAELNVSGNKIYCPGDFVDYVGLYVVSTDGYLAPLYLNKNINIGQESLQDEDSFYLLDDAGYVIGAYGLTPRVDNSVPYTYYGVDLNALSLSEGQQIYQIKPGEISANGMYRYDAANREFIVDGLNIEKVVLEYVSDPILRHKLKMDMGEIRVHKNYQEALENNIYYKLVEINRHVPAYEKARALKAYKMALKRANMRKLSINELIQVLRGNR